MTSTTGARFVDTNVLLYAASRVPALAGKSAAAQALLAGGGIAFSVQVLQEFYVQATRATRAGALAPEDAFTLVEAWLRFPVQENSVLLMRAAIASSRRFQISYWDAAIIEAARLQGCRTVLSEDLSHGQNYDGVRVVNPFR